jgi:Cu(I)/Ag(I) efflux system membrane fusion protein
MTAPSPFEPSRSRRPLRIAGLLAATLATAALLWRFIPSSARSPGSPSVAPATAGGGGSGAAPAQVTLGPPEQRAIGITFAPVVHGPLEQVTRSVGIVAYDESRLTTITSKVEGWVEALTVDFTGQAVRRGQPVLTLYAPEIVTAQEELLLGLRLLGDLRNGSDDARRSAEEMVAASRRKLENWDVSASEIAALEGGGAPSRTVTLRARSSGFAVEKTVQAGQRVMPGDPLYRIADLRVVWVEGEVYERDLPLLRLGGGVRAGFAALPGVERRGRVGYIYPIVNADTRTVRVRIELDNGDQTLRPGMYATLEFEGPGRTTLSIPRSAALVTGKRSLVFLKRPGGRLEPREVTLGAGTDDRYEVLSGLALGDTVVASGTFLLDAESNLGTMLGGMGGMPGMDMTPAPAAPRTAPKTPSHPHG